MSEGGTIKFAGIVDVVCTFCLGKVCFGKAENGDYCLTHTMPPCEAFIQLDILDFMVRNRRNLGIPDPEEN